ncbi:hypothetical protein NUU61_009940 [Penicillium alfredii]|uniref:Zn(2)-C6 fungal-type domain-containing protein n=1 Tax=Penicillium alfredii TaxID=1506179 RepID=A0A9W9JU68_9EURO|nr:uncharacterized protein NUU61_009940 [Penicillium alfredii]KAJ5081676.1 hypothetical protein NUU61_009940 [Penicillium alfredii]
MEETSPARVETSTAEKQWKCSECASIFRRQDHLKRHTLTPYRDVLRRHWKSCKARVEAGHAMPAPFRSGKQKRACDSCAGLRKACNGEQPCSECGHRHRRCTYQRLGEEDDPAGSGSRILSNLERQDRASQMDVVSGSSASEQPWSLGLQTFYPSREASMRIKDRYNYAT